MKSFFLSILIKAREVPAMIERYSKLITGEKGKIHRLEGGVVDTCYPINKVMKAHYVLMNIECDQATVNELGDNFRYNDAVIRNLISRATRAVTEPSPVVKERDGRGGSGDMDMLGMEPASDRGDRGDRGGDDSRGKSN